MTVTPDILVARYKSLRHTHPSLDVIRWQILDMARGGDGGPTGFNDMSVREYTYPDKSDTFFQEIVLGMGW